MDDVTFTFARMFSNFCECVLFLPEGEFLKPFFGLRTQCFDISTSSCTLLRDDSQLMALAQTVEIDSHCLSEPQKYWGHFAMLSAKCYVLTLYSLSRCVSHDLVF